MLPTPKRNEQRLRGELDAEGASVSLGPRADAVWRFLENEGILTTVDLLLALARHEGWTDQLARKVHQAPSIRDWKPWKIHGD